MTVWGIEQWALNVGGHKYLISRHHLNVFPTASLYYISILKVLLIFACVYITSQKLKVCNFSKVEKTNTLYKMV